jgi:hypothetical protein
MEEGRWYIVYMDLDKPTDRLYATNILVFLPRGRESIAKNSADGIKEREGPKASFFFWY